VEGGGADAAWSGGESENNAVAILRKAKSLRVFRSALEENFSQPNSIVEESLA
jgi:hypothetical protein